MPIRRPSPTGLYWSIRGTVLCATHAEQVTESAWEEERWEPLPETSQGLRGAYYRCQRCSPDGTALAHAPARTSTAPPMAERKEGVDADGPLILNVDDQPANLYARDRTLRKHGFTVANAGTGRAALDVARRLRPNLILLDVHLPDMDGRDLCKQLKSDTELSSISVVLISATLRGHVNQLETVRWGNADAFIAEPVEPDALAATIWKVLGAA